MLTLDTAMVMRRVEQSANFSSSPPMEKSTNSDENYDNEQFAAETPVYSTMSADSFRYCRSSSGTSEFSEAIDDRSFSSEASASRWPSIKSGRHNPVVLSRLGLKHLQHDHDEKLVSLESVDSGRLESDYLLSCSPA